MDLGNAERLSCTCSVCKLFFEDMESYENHLKSKEHVTLSKRIRQRLFRRRSAGDDPVGTDLNSCTHQDSTSEPLQNRLHLESLTEREENLQESETVVDAGDRLTCDICKITFADLMQYKLHVSSKSHKRAIRAKKLEEIIKLYDTQSHLTASGGVNPATAEYQPYRFCALCNKQFEGPEDYFQHMGSKFHKKRVALQKLFNRISMELTDSEDNASEDEEAPIGQPIRGSHPRRSRSFVIGDNVYECKYCDKSFTEATDFARHLTSKFHEREKRKNSLIGELRDLLAEESDECNS